MLNWIWLFSLVFTYLYFAFTTPTKVPPPIVLAPVVEEVKDVKAAEPVVAQEAPKAEVEMNPVDIEKGKQIYLSTCTRCHNKDPNIKGSIGPEIVDAPLDIMKYKLETGKYPDVLPPGFVPKRKTKLMQKFPQLVKDAASIHAYVQSIKK